MKRIALAAALALAASGAAAQTKAGAVVVEQAEAVVTVTKVDREKRLVTFRNPQGALGTIQVPPEAQNLDRVKPGARFKMKYVEAAAVALKQGGAPAAQVSEEVRLAPKGGNPGGVVVQTAEVSGVIDAIDYKTRYMAVRGPKGNTLSFKVADDVPDLEKVAVGDRIAVTFTQALALEMIPQQPAKKAPAKKQ